MKKGRLTHSLDVHPSYKGGRTIVYNGYIHEFCPGHHLDNQWGWVAQHRLIGEDIAGRRLVVSRDSKVRECVHHIDENRLNNSPDNLQIMTFSAHRSLHTRKRNLENTIAGLPEQVVRDALEGRTIKDAAKHLGVTHMTLRKHWPELVAPRKRNPPTFSDSVSLKKLDEILTFASDNQISMRDCEKKMNIASRTIIKICKKYGIKWVPKSKKGLIKRTYAGVPTRRWLEANGLLTESDSPSTD